MYANDLSQAVWRKSSRSNSGPETDCVEVAPLVNGIAVRDSKDPNGPAFVFDAREWSALVQGIRSGELS